MSNFNEAFRLVQVNRISVIDFNERCAIHNPQVTEAWIQIDVTILVFFRSCARCAQSQPHLQSVILNVGEDLHLAWKENWFDGFIRSAALSLPPARVYLFRHHICSMFSLIHPQNPTRYCNGIHRSKFRPAVRRYTPHRLGLSGRE